MARTLASWLCALLVQHEGARGGTSCLGVARPGSGALPPPTARPLGGLPGPTGHWLWVRGGAGVGSRHQPHSAALASWLCALWGRHEGAWGGRLLPGCGVSGVGRSPPPDCPPSGRAAGAHYPLAVGAGGCGRGDPSPTPQRALFGAGFARYGGGTRAPGGERLLPGCGVSGVGRSPSPDCPPSGRAAGAHYPLAVGAGGCGRGDPSPAPQRALLRAGFARCGGGMRVPGGAPLALVRGVRGQALSHPRLPGLWAGCRGPLPTGCGAGGCGRGDPSPTPQRALFRAGFAPVGAARGGWGGASCLGVGRPGSGALPPPTARPLGGLPGPTTHWLWERGGPGVGTRHQPHSVRSCELALRAMGAARGRPRGGRLLPGCGASGVGRSPTPDCPPSGRAAGAHYPLAVGAGGCGRGDPSPTPQCALLRAGFARCGGGMRVPGGAPLAWVLGVRGRALSHPRLPALWAGCRGPLPSGCGPGGCGRGDPSPTPQRALFRAGFARCGGGTRGLGGRLLPGCGASGVGRSPTPDCPPSGRAAGAHYRLAVGAGGSGRGDPSPAPRRALLRAGFARCGGGTRAPRGGAPPAWWWGVRCRALSHPRLPALWAGCGGPLPTGCGCGGVRAWRPVTNPTARALASWLCALWGRHEGARGGASCLGVGRPGSGALPPRTARPLGGLPGPTTHWLWLRGGAGVGTCHKPHSARSCELALRAVGAA